MKKSVFCTLLTASLFSAVLATVPSQSARGADTTQTESVIYDNKGNRVPTETNVNNHSIVDNAKTLDSDNTVNKTKNAQFRSSLDEDNDVTTIYDKNGNKVELEPVAPGALVRGTAQPRTIKRLNKGQSYMSNPFSGSGMRYGGYMFGITSGKVMITVAKSAFTTYITGSTDPNFVVQTATLKPSGSPYTYNPLKGYIYFGVYNPVSGSTYGLKAK